MDAVIHALLSYMFVRREQMLLKNSDFYLSIFFIGLSIFIFIQSLQMPEQAQQFPMLISIPLCIFSCALLVKTVIRKKAMLFLI